jgi:hypothetical protein
VYGTVSAYVMFLNPNLPNLGICPVSKQKLVNAVKPIALSFDTIRSYTKYVLAPDILLALVFRAHGGIIETDDCAYSTETFRVVYVSGSEDFITFAEGIPRITGRVFVPPVEYEPVDSM